MSTSTVDKYIRDLYSDKLISMARRPSVLADMFEGGWAMVVWCNSCQIDWWLADGGLCTDKCLRCSGEVEVFEEALAASKLAGEEAGMDIADARRDELSAKISRYPLVSGSHQVRGGRVGRKPRSVTLDVKLVPLK